MPAWNLFSDKNIWVFGVLVNVVGSVVINLGTNIMKFSHNIANEQSSASYQLYPSNSPQRQLDIDSESAVKDPRIVWRIGMATFVIGSVLNFVSFAFATQSLLACLGTVQLISNVFFAKFVLQETLTSRIFAATAIIIVGLILAIVYSNHGEQTFTTTELQQLYSRNYICFIIAESIILLVLHFIYTYYIDSASKGFKLPGHRLVVPCCYAQISATIGTQSLLQSKCMAELLKATFEGSNQLTNGFTYVIILGFVIGISFWLYRMNSALKQFEGLVIIPLLQIFWITSAIIQGGVYFQEFEKFSVTQVIGFSTGVIIVIFGAYLLVPSSENETKPRIQGPIDLLNGDDDWSSLLGPTSSEGSSSGVELSYQPFGRIIKVP